jgi:hypothetical protein
METPGCVDISVNGGGVFPNATEQLTPRNSSPLARWFQPDPELPDLHLLARKNDLGLGTFDFTCILCIKTKSIPGSLSQFQRLCTRLYAGADITDYFNYGFTEETWRKYAEKQRMLRGDSAKVWMGQGRVAHCRVTIPVPKSCWLSEALG